MFKANAPMHLGGTYTPGQRYRHAVLWLGNAYYTQPMYFYQQATLLAQRNTNKPWPVVGCNKALVTW